MNTSHRRILIVDDNAEIHNDFRKILTPRQAGALDDMEAALFGAAPSITAQETYQLESAYQGQDAVEMVTAARRDGRPFSMAFVDMRMPPGMDGLETIERLWQVDPELQVVICTAYSERSREEIVQRTGLTHRLVILKKPFDLAEVAQLACAMTEKWKACRLADLKLNELEEIVHQRTAQIAATSKRLELSEQRYSLAAAGANDGLWDWDIQSGRVYYSPRWKSILDLPASWPGATVADWLLRIHPDDFPVAEETLRRHVEGKSTHLEFEHRLRRADGSYGWVLCRGLAVRDEHAVAVRVAGSLTDIGRRKETEDLLRHGAYYDRLTGLPNRALLRECLDRAAADVRADNARRFAVLFLDFDRFKVVNDSLGHQAGDQLLVAIAARLTACLGQLPRPRGGHTLARLGGDEFVILLRDLEDEKTPHAVAEAIEAAFREPFQIQDYELYTAASIGIAIASADHAYPDEVMRDADTAMYNAKALGGARHVVCDASMREHAVARLRLENDLRSAVDRGELHVVYQPIVSLDTGRPIAAEALLRWNHPVEGLISPERFIPIAEETGLIVPLGEFVLRSACRDLKILQDSAPGRESLCMNVNISSRQFGQGSLADLVSRTVASAGLRPDSLALEVTETAVMEDFDAAAATLGRIRARGISVYMDDFGTGYSSLSCLKSLPLSGLKLDRSFVAQLTSESITPAIIHAVVTLASHLKLLVVAEGVETREQLASLMTLDCHRVQGYLFGKPMRLEELQRWFDTQEHAPRMAA